MPTHTLLQDNVALRKNDDESWNYTLYDISK